MDQLWAPWRSQYITKVDVPKREGCIFCWKPQEDESRDEENLIVVRRKHCFVLMNLYPYNNGHLMVVPYRHTGDFLELGEEELLECQRTLQDAQRIMKETMTPQGFNIGMNIGRPAGAGIDQHLHWHLVPRWNGDTNFMPALAATKVISEGLLDSWRRMREGFARL